MAELTHGDAEHPGNAPIHHTGRKCRVDGCDKPAGTAWSEYWCWECNSERLDRVSRQLKELARPAQPSAKDNFNYHRRGGTQ